LRTSCCHVGGADYRLLALIAASSVPAFAITRRTVAARSEKWRGAAPVGHCGRMITTDSGLSTGRTSQMLTIVF